MRGQGRKRNEAGAIGEAGGKPGARLQGAGGGGPGRWVGSPGRRTGRSPGGPRPVPSDPALCLAGVWRPSEQVAAGQEARVRVPFPIRRVPVLLHHD